MFLFVRQLGCSENLSSPDEIGQLPIETSKEKQRNMNRYIIKQVAENQTDHRTAWTVIDTAAAIYHMPEQAITLNVTHESAVVICAELNQNWLAFCQRPW